MYFVWSDTEAIYYFKLVGYLFFEDKKTKLLKIDFIQKIVFGVLVFFLIFIGIAPFVISNFLLNSATIMLDISSYIKLLVGV